MHQVLTRHFAAYHPPSPSLVSDGVDDRFQQVMVEGLMAGKRAAGEGTFWKRGDRWYGKRRVGPREAVVTINASGATRAEAATALRETVNQYERGLTVEVDNSATLAQYLDWWLKEELAEQVATVRSWPPPGSST